MFPRILLLTPLVGLVLPGTMLAQDDWSGRLVPFIGRPPLGSAYDAISEGHALRIGSVLGVAYDLGTPLRLLGLRAGASRTIGAEAVGAGSPSDGVFGSVGIDALELGLHAGGLRGDSFSTFETRLLMGGTAIAEVSRGWRMGLDWILFGSTSSQPATCIVRFFREASRPLEAWRRMWRQESGD